MFTRISDESTGEGFVENQKIKSKKKKNKMRPNAFICEPRDAVSESDRYPSREAIISENANRILCRPDNGIPAAVGR